MKLGTKLIDYTEQRVSLATPTLLSYGKMHETR